MTAPAPEPAPEPGAEPVPVPEPDPGYGGFAVDSLDHVQLTAPPGSEDVLRSFYAGVLGMAETAKPPALAARGGCWFTAGSAALHLGIEEDFRPAAKAHPGIRVRGIDALAERLGSAGAPVAWDDGLPGHRRFYSSDPVGNRLEFLEPET